VQRNIIMTEARIFSGQYPSRYGESRGHLKATRSSSTVTHFSPKTDVRAPRDNLHLSSAGRGPAELARIRVIHDGRSDGVDAVLDRKTGIHTKESDQQTEI